MKYRKRKPNFPEGHLEEIQTGLKQVKKPSQIKKLQAVWLASKFELGSKQIAEMLGYSAQYVKEIWLQYRKKGINFLLNDKRGSGNSGGRFLLFNEEEEFLKPFLNKAEKGGILTVSIVHKALEEKLGRKIHLDTIYKLLHRHGWRKIVPRKYHPKADKQKQEEFKTNFKDNLEKFKKNSQRKET